MIFGLYAELEFLSGSTNFNQASGDAVNNNPEGSVCCFLLKRRNKKKETSYALCSGIPNVKDVNVKGDSRKKWEFNSFLSVQLNKTESVNEIKNTNFMQLKSLKATDIEVKGELESTVAKVLEKAKVEDCAIILAAMEKAQAARVLAAMDIGKSTEIIQSVREKIGMSQDAQIEPNIQSGKAAAILKMISKPVDGVQQKILFGCPGTGKSHKVQSEYLQGAGSENIFKCVFHPEYSYGDFMGKLMPLTVPLTNKDGNADTETGEQVTYRFYEGHFLSALAQAYKNIKANQEKPNQVFLVIDEINRGNTAAIFGSVLQLLDREDNGISSYAIRVSEMEYNKIKELAGITGDDSLPPCLGKNREIKLPANLSIIGTMNTSDESIYYMDSAFKRRWDWEYIDLKSGIDGLKKVKIGEAFWTEFVDKLNQFIRDQGKFIRRVEDKQIGYWFIKAKGKVISVDQIKNKLMFFLWDSVFQRDKAPLETLLDNGSKLVTFADFSGKADNFISQINDYPPSKP